MKHFFINLTKTNPFILIGFVYLLFGLSSFVLSASNNIHHDDRQFELSLTGFVDYENAMDIASLLKKKNLLKLLDVQGTRTAHVNSSKKTGQSVLNQWEYKIIVARDVGYKSAKIIHSNLKELGYSNVKLTRLNKKTHATIATLSEEAFLETVGDIGNDDIVNKVDDDLIKDISKKLDIIEPSITSDSILVATNDNQQAAEILLAQKQSSSNSIHANKGSEKESEDEIILIDDSDEKSGDESEIIIMEDDDKESEMILIDDDEAKDKDKTDIKAKALKELYGLYTKLDEQNTKLEWGYNLQLEEQFFNQSVSPIASLSYVHIDAYANWVINSSWNILLGGRVDGNFAQGTNTSDSDSETNADYTDSYIRYRDDKYRVTAGAQVINWGIMDSSSPNDHLSTIDASRGVLIKTGDNYRSSNAIRTELFFDKTKVDIVYIPRFREAELAEPQQIWSPINYKTGRVLGLAPNPILASLIKLGRTSLDDSFEHESGYGLRLSTTQNAVDLALSMQRIQLSTPYYRFVPTGPASLNIVEEHPNNWIVGADMAVEFSGITWRAEASWLSDVPVTTVARSQYKTIHAYEWAVGMEFYPGDSDTRVNLQLGGKELQNTEKIIDRNNILAISGSLESEFYNGKWKFNTRYSVGLDMDDLYLSPELSYLGWDGTEIYASFHYLDGTEESLGGFYKSNTQLGLGVRIKH